MMRVHDLFTVSEQEHIVRVHGVGGRVHDVWVHELTISLHECMVCGCTSVWCVGARVHDVWVHECMMYGCTSALCVGARVHGGWVHECMVWVQGVVGSWENSERVSKQ